MKYHNKKVYVNGIKFDSMKEARRYRELKLMEEKGLISNLQTQVPFEIFPAYVREDGKKIRAIKYIADFVYYQNDKRVIEDTKGVRTQVYKIKKKMMEKQHGRITEL